MLDAQDEFVVIEVGQIEFIVDRGDSWQPFHVLDLSIARNLRHLLSKLVKLIVIVVFPVLAFHRPTPGIPLDPEDSSFPCPS